MTQMIPVKELQALHDRVGAIWTQEREHLFGGACGYSILGSRPTYRPRLMVVGENPGFCVDDARGGAHIYDTWPTGSYLDGKTWPMKDRLRDLFTRAQSMDLLAEAVFTNFNFFKSGSQTRASQHRWHDVDQSARRRVEQASLTGLKNLIELINPREVMVLGMSAFDRHANGCATEQRCTDGKRRLISTGKLWGVPAFAMMHPSGARWSEGDKNEAALWLKAQISPKG